MASSLQPPKKFEGGENPAEAWEKWRQLVEIYWIAAELEQKPNKIQKATLLHIVGEEGISLFNTFTFEIEEDENGQIPNVDETITVNMILDAFSEHYTPYKNETYIRHIFFTTNQSENQTFDEYVKDLRIKARDCGFNDLKDSLIRDRLVCGIKNNGWRQKLLKTRDLDLAKCIRICRAEEESEKQVTKMFTATSSVDAIGKQRFSKQNSNFQKRQFVCGRCGSLHKQDGRCPAIGDRCRKCNKYNHWAKACKAVSTKVNAIEAEEVSEEEGQEDIKIGAIYVAINEITSKTNEWLQEIAINGQMVTFKLDTGSQANLLPKSIFKKIKETSSLELQKNKNKLVAYSGDEIKVEGICYMKGEMNKVERVLEFYITKGNAQPLLGLTAIQELGLIKRVEMLKMEKREEEWKRECEAIVEDFRDVFQGLGCMETKYKIRICETEPVHARCRRIPRPLADKVKKQLDQMEKDGIIERTEEFTEWAHPIVVVLKADDSVRVCMDPRPLNKVIKLEKIPLPTAESTLAEIADSKYFTVLDASSAFHQIPLEEESSKLCTITTPHGRYKYLRLPYGLSCSSEAFQKEMYKIVKNTTGIVTYADDVLIHGRTLEEHNERLRVLLTQARKANMKFKKDKTQLAVKKIKYLGYWISEEGIQISDEKVQAIRDMEPPRDKGELQRFLGMVNYLSKFIPNMSKATHVLRNLLKNDSQWIWEEVQEECFNNLKMLVCSSPILQKFDDQKEIIIATDSSKYAIGGVLLQDDHPVSYCSASLNETQTRYSVIEKELLGIVVCCEHFHYYIYGRVITIKTDHKPLIGLVQKPIDDLSPRLQSLVLRLLRYKVNLEYQPGRTMYLADTLSRLKSKAEKKIYGDLEMMNKYKVQSIVVASKKRCEELKEETAKDEELQEVLYYIRNGWPRKISGVKELVKPYFQSRYEIFENNGFMFKNKKLIIPGSLRREMMEKVHVGHMGIGSNIRRAQDAFFWPNLTRDITDFVSSCWTCQKQSRSNVKEPMKATPLAKYPWERISMDFLKANNNQFILIADYFSKFAIIEQLKTTTARTVINSLKRIFYVNGLPTQIRSDNGPPFDSIEFRRFLQEEEIEHVTSSPKYPRSNGFIERHIQTIKNMILKAVNEDVDKVVMIYNNTPKENFPAPAEVFMGRKIRTNLPISEKLLEGNQKQALIIAKQKQDKQIEYYDRTTSSRKPLNNEVLMQKEKRQWIPAKIVRQAAEPNSFWVQTDDGAEYRRNKIHLKNLVKGEEETTEVQEQHRDEQQDESDDKSPERYHHPEQHMKRSMRERKLPNRFKDYVL